MKDKFETKSLFVSIVGRPNVGKSSILNMIVGSKVSIVSSKPQTTRNRITGIITQGDTQLVFIDTPGIHKPFSRLGDYMISEIDNSLSGIEACLHVVEALKEPSPLDLNLIEKFAKLNLKTILAINKIDLVKNKSFLMDQIKKFSSLFNYDAIVPISALSNDGKENLMTEMKALAKPSVFFFSNEDFTDQSERKLVSEIIREKLLWFLDEELPHGTAIQVESFKQLPNSKVSIHAVIYCERSSHKAMIIGAGGQMIKKVGIASRRSIEELLGCEVNLNLFVKVKKDWRNKPALLHELGYC